VEAGGGFLEKEKVSTEGKQKKDRRGGVKGDSGRIGIRDTNKKKEGKTKDSNFMGRAKLVGIVS